MLQEMAQGSSQPVPAFHVKFPTRFTNERVKRELVKRGTAASETGRLKKKKRVKNSLSLHRRLKLQIDCFVSSHTHLPGWVFMRRGLPLAALIKGNIVSSADPFVHGNEIRLDRLAHIIST